MPTGRPNGRPAKPVEKKTEQNIVSTSAFTASFSVPRTPTGLGKEGRAIWKQLWNAGQSWLNVEQDYTLIKLVCEATDDLYSKRASLQNGSVEEVYMLSNGAWANHPYVGQVKDLRIQITAWLSALGFSPADRARLGITESKPATPFDELAKRKAEREAKKNV